MQPPPFKVPRIAHVCSPASFPCIPLAFDGSIPLPTPNVEVEVSFFSTRPSFSSPPFLRGIVFRPPLTPPFHSRGAVSFFFFLAASFLFLRESPGPPPPPRQRNPTSFFPPLNPSRQLAIFLFFFVCPKPRSLQFFPSSSQPSCAS